MILCDTVTVVIKLLLMVHSFTRTLGDIGNFELFIA